MTRIRLATCNTRGAIGRDRRHDPERIASVLNEIDADVVALQEVDARPPRRTGQAGVPGHADRADSGCRADDRQEDRGPWKRRAGALRGRLDAADPMPTVLMGDLNEWFLWGRPLRWLHRYFEETPAPATFPARVPLLAEVELGRRRGRESDWKRG